MRESGHVKMAKLSGAPERDIMFKEMLPNLIPYLAASFIGNTSGAILTAIGLEVQTWPNKNAYFGCDNFLR